MNTKQQTEYLTKISSAEEALEIIIVDDQKKQIGQLKPITKNHLYDDSILKKITDWRNANKDFFLTQFTATPERTRNWLESTVIANHTQMMFLIYSDEQLLGHYGFKELTEKSVLLDNAMRGERGGHPMLIKYAAQALINWLFDVMQVEEIYGYIIAKNPMAIKLNRDLGFTFKEKLPLHKKVDGDETKWIMGHEDEKSLTHQYYQKIVMTRED